MSDSTGWNGISASIQAELARIDREARTSDQIYVNLERLLPPIVAQIWGLGQSIIPLGVDKRPLVEWKQYQETQPQVELVNWIRALGDRIWGWARITGARGDVIVLDFDGETAAATMRAWGLDPHLQTRHGYHVILRHPGWRVKTVNSKTSKQHGETYPGVDIRGDGGYSVVYSVEEELYEWLRDPEDVDELEVLSEAARRFFGLWEAPSEELEAEWEWEEFGGNNSEEENEELEEEETDPGSSVPHEWSTPGNEFGRPTAALFLRRALKEGEVSGRNNGGLWFCIQMRDHRYSKEETLETGKQYVQSCPETSPDGEVEPYTIEDFTRTLDQVFSRPPRDPWGVNRNEEIKAYFGESMKEDTGGGTTFDIDRLLVPTEIGCLQEYPPWAVQGFVRMGGRGILYGMSGGAKSYAVSDLARAASTGGQWMGDPVLTGSVIYIAAEDHIGIHHRVEAAIKHAGKSRLHQVRVLEQSLPITNETIVRGFLSALDDLSEKPTFVVIDNLSLCMGDGDPNDGKDAKRFIDGCELIQKHRWRESKRDVAEVDKDRPITVIIVHHTNKTLTFNGSQYFENLVDGMSELRWDRRSPIRIIFPRKQRHGNYHDPLPFDLLEVNEHDQICVVRSLVMPPPRDNAERANRKLLETELAVISCLSEAKREQVLTATVNDEEPALTGLTRGEISIRSGMQIRIVGRHISSLKSAGLISIVHVMNERGKLVPTKNPEYVDLTPEGVRVAQSAPPKEFERSGRP